MKEDAMIIQRILQGNEAALPLMDTFIVSNVHQQGTSIELRIVATQKPHPDAINVQPKIEDIYVYHFGNPHEVKN